MTDISLDGRTLRATENDEAGKVGGETATGHSVGEAELLADGRVRVEDEWEWESKPGSGETVLVEIEE